MTSALDTLSTVGHELTTEQLDLAAGGRGVLIVVFSDGSVLIIVY